jgi:fermentation-respiration switch protein FrsA (DUF1100 family)
VTLFRVRLRGSFRTAASGLVLALALSGCTADGWPGGPAATGAPVLPPPPTVTGASPTETVFEPLPPIEPLAAPPTASRIGWRTVELANGDRPLPTRVFYPADASGEPAPGVFPLVLFSHGLRTRPDTYQQHLELIAAAGFIVAAPAYPHTNRLAERYDPLDVINQPADATAVITALLDLAAQDDGWLAGRIDPARIGAMGHSGGGYTTMGLLVEPRDVRIRACVVIAGSSHGGALAGPASPVLFVHGTDDAIVPYQFGRSSYDQLPFPKAFLTVVGAGHSDYLTTLNPASGAVRATVLDFLRATLYGDEAAAARIPADATVDSVTNFEHTLDLPEPSPEPSIAPTPEPTPSENPVATPVQS